MAFKTFQVDTIGEITVYKRRGSHSLRLTIRSDGSVRVTVPSWSSYAAGVAFAKSRASWIQTHAKPPTEALQSNQLIGKAHRLVFIATTQSSKPTSRIVGNEIRISYPAELQSSDARVQAIANRAAKRALKQQAEQLLPTRLATLARQHDLVYRSVNVKQLKTRWGSCDQDKNIILNLFLMQLPWELIDYVLLHELTHTLMMQHGPRFWAAMEQLEPKTPERRKAIRAFRTIIQ